MAEAMAWVSKITTVSLTFALPPIIGSWIDYKLGLFNTFPVFVLLGAIVGFVGGIMSLLQMVKR